VDVECGGAEGAAAAAAAAAPPAATPASPPPPPGTPVFAVARLSLYMHPEELKAKGYDSAAAGAAGVGGAAADGAVPDPALEFSDDAAAARRRAVKAACRGRRDHARLGGGRAGPNCSSTAAARARHARAPASGGSDLG
jgi:hypothetical protein